ncbi:MAG TPA: DUF4124 domain-containing protein [Geobacteraceae bacterium]|nr:DUF4124 domain-containing protein [Geobacteraceae bacterium]
MKKLLLILLLFTAAAQAETYKWIDDGGTVHFTDSPIEVPAKYRKSVEPIEADKTRDSSNDSKPNPDNDWGGPQQGAGGQAALPPKAEELKDRMMNDEGIMTLIRALQDDPDMRALLGDPALMRAVQAGDIGTLINNPAFLKLLDNPRVKEIERKLNSRTTQ